MPGKMLLSISPKHVGMVWYVWYGMVGYAWYGMVVWCGMVWYGVVWWYGMSNMDKSLDE